MGFYLAVFLVALSLFRLIPAPWMRGTAGIGVSWLPTVLGALAVNAALVKWRGYPSAALGWRGRGQTVRCFAAGTAVGVAMAFGALTLAVVAGGARIVVLDGGIGSYASAAVGLALVLLVAALGEELLFRGYPLARLAQGVGRVPASLALAVVFVGMHVANPATSVLGLANIGLAALVLSAAFFTTGGLPLAWGVHFGWNGGLSLGADAPVSGIPFGLPLLDFTAGGPGWLTGGSFGPEGGLVATVVMALALVGLVRHTAPDVAATDGTPAEESGAT